MTDKPDATTKIPRHIGIIMDGNGRWARQRGLARTNGHREGLSAAKRIVKAASDFGIRYLTLYTFSTENWKRPRAEVAFIMNLIKQYLRSEFNFYRENGIRLRHAGDARGLPADIASELAGAVEDTKNFSGLQVILALNYGGRDEIVRAIQKLARSGLYSGEEKIDRFSENDFALFMDNADIPDPDLIIRTAGEYRTSNFLIWEAAYAEWYFSEKLWPDWGKEDLAAALTNYGERDRRYGNVPVLNTSDGETQ